MKELKKHEEFEIGVLDQMRRVKVLDHLVFGGGTMLRLCYDLPRYSVDLDFYLKKEREDFLPWVPKLTEALRDFGAEITDQQEKHFSFLWEIRKPGYPRRLKIEIRKNEDELERTNIALAHSTGSTLQVRLLALTLEQMWINKIRALIDRQAIRDAYDLEFLSLRKAGDFKTLSPETLESLASTLNSFKPSDYKVVLGNLLEREERERVLSSRFAYLKSCLS